MWACLAVVTLTYFIGASQMASQGTREAVWQNVTAHASHLADELSENPDAEEIVRLKARLSHAIASSDLLAIAVYTPINRLDTMRRLAVQSASDSTLAHFPATIDTPSDWVEFERPSSTEAGDIHIATSISVVNGKIHAAIRVATPMGRAEQMIGVYRAWGSVFFLIFMIATYYVGDRFARRFHNQIEVTSGQVQAIARGDYTFELAAAPTLEFELLQACLHDLAHSLADASTAAGVMESAEHRTRELETAEEIRVLRTGLEERSRMLDLAYLEMQTLDRAKDTFLSNLSHEMRTPLTSIIAAEEILTDYADNDPEARPGFLGIIHSESERLLVLIDELLDLAKIEAKALQLNFEEIDLCQLTEHISAQVFSQNRDRKVALSISKPTEAVRCECDPDRMSRILRGIVEEAFQYSPDLGTVRIGIQTIDSCARIVVEDDAAFSEDRNRDMFGQRDQPGDDFMTGSTLFGPAIAKKLAKAHGGTLTQRRSASDGTIVELTLPIRGTNIGGEIALQSAGTIGGGQDA